MSELRSPWYGLDRHGHGRGYGLMAMAMAMAVAMAMTMAIAIAMAKAMAIAMPIVGSTWIKLDQSGAIWINVVNLSC